MRDPAFWWRPGPSPQALLLAPASLIWGAVAGRRMGRSGARAPVPVICIGNLTLGGAGKTPTALAAAALLRQAGASPAFLTRGYGGRLPGPLRVEAGHRAADVGDEPLLLARAAPTVVARDRVAGARLAAAGGAGVIVMDDGLQNPSLAKDLALAVVDGGAGLGNRRVLPAGPLRAPLRAQWPRIDAVLVIGGGEPGERAAADGAAEGKPVLRGRLGPDPGAAAAFRGRRVLAFAGIGRPQKFFDTLLAAGAVLEEVRPFPDHHPFTAAELRDLRDTARRRGLVLTTTEKDAARIGPEAEVATLPVRLEVDDPAAWRALLVGALTRPSG
ncbi:MAG TPA: tetraacyldisaccharide 4'-kinase [Microvirga sp.]|nr:tetraacyldisaccharide 4'-kinase [Microvirga sp.]